jgi:hypothetical protein
MSTEALAATTTAGTQAASTATGGAGATTAGGGAQTASTATGGTQQTAATTTSTNFRDFIGDDGKFKPGWTKAYGAPETLESKFTEPKALIGSYASLERMIAAKGVIKPGADATPEQRDAYFNALGRPAKPEDYAITMPEKVGDKPFPKELWNGKLAEGAAKVFHAAGLTKEQADAVTALHNEITLGAKADLDAMIAKGDVTALKAHPLFTTIAAKEAEAGGVALRTEWGAQFDTNLALAKKAAEQAGGAELLAHPLANDPMFIKAMAKVGAMIVEKPVAGARGTQGTQMDPATEIASIMGDLKHAYHANFKANGYSQQQHDAAVQHMKSLYERKNPG